MLPDKVLSSTVIPGNYLPPDGQLYSRVRDYELGGIALQDPSQGSMYQVWECNLYIDPETLVGTVTLQAPTVPEFTVWVRPGVTDISFTFDQNMNPFIAFLEAGVAKYWWFDVLVNEQIFSDLPAGSTAPVATLDDKRRTQTGASDIILAYTRAGNLYFRAQRDRYLVEYLLKAGVTGRAIQIGMADVRRVQFEVGALA